MFWNRIFKGRERARKRGANSGARSRFLNFLNGGRGRLSGEEKPVVTVQSSYKQGVLTKREKRVQKNTVGREEIEMRQRESEYHREARLLNKGE